MLDITHPFCFFLLLHEALIQLSGSATAASVNLAWNRNPEPDIAGYRLKFGSSQGVYTDQVDVSNQTTGTASGLVEGVKYFFVVTAYNTAGLESLPSNEVAYNVPTPTPSPTPTPTPTPKPTATPTPTPTPTPTLTPTPTPTPTTDQSPSPTPEPEQVLLNVSTRGAVNNGDGVMIGGFIVSGATAKQVVVRAIGPSLAEAGVTGFLADPDLELYDSSGSLVKENDNASFIPEEIIAAGLAPRDPAESLIATRLLPGAYTAVVRGANGGTGIALCEVFDLTPSSSRVSNISTRGQIGGGQSVMIGGFILGGRAPTKVIVRAIGPSLTALGVVGALQDPMVELHDSDGSLIFSNDNWRSDQEGQIIASTISPSDDKESAIVATLSPGAYTAIVRSSDGTSGVALVEVYDLEP
jgi:hypothetical protein